MTVQETAELDWDNSPDANEPPWSIVRAADLFNRWSSQCTVSRLGPVEQTSLLIRMVAEALKEAKEEGKELETQAH